VATALQTNLEVPRLLMVAVRACLEPLRDPDLDLAAARLEELLDRRLEAAAG
jgi:hypothetical protein